ncbi:DUF4386 domain-containing protein [Agromyces sp. SYSU T0242]|uniref:DUF4386 domain-containing protein n=1 Tax=Agromyces litoreus TaxID=3158561 RepID=UPI003395A04A
MDANGAGATRTAEGPIGWFASAGALALMAVLGFAALGAIAELGSTAAPDEVIARSDGRFGWVVLALYGIAVLDVVVAWGLWVVLRTRDPRGAVLAAALRLVYAAAFVAAIGHVGHAVRIADGADAPAIGRADRAALVQEQLQAFDAAWNGALLVFGAHLVVVGVLLVRRAGVAATVVGVLVGVAGLGYAADTVIRLLASQADPGIAMFTFIGEVVLIGWLVAGGIRSARSRGEVDDPPTSRPSRRALAGEGA